MDGWVDGWYRARDAQRPLRVDGGWFIRVGAARESQRFVLNPVRRDRLSEILAGPVALHTCVKFAAGRSEWLDAFPSGWDVGEPTWMMLRALPAEISAMSVAGYDVAVESGPDVATVRVRAADGTVAASGRMGLGASYVVPDQIVTEPAHRRRGLGSLVMAELETIALDSGRRRAVLGATADGRALYERLGWQLGSGLIGAHYRPGSVLV